MEPNQVSRPGVSELQSEDLPGSGVCEVLFSFGDVACASGTGVRIFR
jgi:hypothetical protein